MAETLKACISGYMTRKYKRGFPINDSCTNCSIEIKGEIHRQESVGKNTELILYKSSIRPNNGTSSFCKHNITISKKIGDNYLCENCCSNELNNEPCSICLEEGIAITTKCGHKFHKKCLIEWISHQNSNNNVFNSSCPVCRQKL